MPLPVLRPIAVAIALPLSALACVSTLGPPRADAPPPARAPYLWVSNEGSGDLTVVDTATDEVVATVPVGKRPRGIRVGPGGRRIYVALTGSPRRPPGISPAFLAVPDRAADGIAVVDAVTRRLARILPSGRGPGAFDLIPGGERLVVSNEETAEASIVDLAAGRIVETVAVGVEPEGVTTAPGGALVAVTSERDHRVDFVDPEAGLVVARVPTCARPRSVAFAPDGALAFATCEEGAAVQVIDARDFVPAAVIPLPAGSRPMGVAMAADGRRLFVSNGRAGTVSAIDVASRRVTATSGEVGVRPRDIAVTPDGRKVYVADGPSDDVAVLDAATLAVVKRIPAGTLPWGLALAP